MPKPLDLNRIKQFEAARPAPADIAMTQTEMPGPAVERWPSREPVRDGQISIKAPLDVIDRFKALCKDDRRTYADMLGILMDRYEQR